MTIDTCIYLIPGLQRRRLLSVSSDTPRFVRAQVLFDLPDFMIISAYTLLAVVWAEAFLQV